MSDVGGYVGLLVGVVAAGISIFIFFHNKYYLHYLRWRAYIWWLLGITVGFIMLVIFVTTVLPLFASKQIVYVILDIVFLLYSIAFVWIAYMKPSLAQQINESVYGILQAEPAKQMTLPELLSHLQKEYKHLGTSLNQYLGNLDYIEQVNVPGTTIILCRLKPPKQAEAVLPMKPVPVVAPYSQAPLVSSPVQAPVQNFMPTSLQPEDMLIPPSSSRTATPTTLEPDKSNLLSSVSSEQQSVKIFCCYAHEDQLLLNKLRTYLLPLQRGGLITLWADIDIGAGIEWEKEIDLHLDTAEVILLLVSPDFMASEYCYSIEMKRAMARHTSGEAKVIPIILRPVYWQEAPFGKLQALPKDGLPVTDPAWYSMDSAFFSVEQGIRKAVLDIQKK